MSNYRCGLAITNSDDVHVIPPKHAQWWDTYRERILDRYDTPQSEKDAAKMNLLPMFLYLRGEIVFHWSTASEKGDPILKQLLPNTHPFHKENNRSLSYAVYGGDYWLNALFSDLGFWDGLHKAGTRGTFILEVGCEHSIDFEGFTYDLYNAAWPAWYLLVATLTDGTWSLEKVYPDPNLIVQFREDDEVASDLHFFWKYEGKMIDIARTSEYREVITKS